MPQLAYARPDLFSQSQAGRILKLHRITVAEVSARLALEWKQDATRPNAKLLDRDDLDTIAHVLRSPIDWDEDDAA